MLPENQSKIADDMLDLDPIYENNKCNNIDSKLFSKRKYFIVTISRNYSKQTVFYIIT